MGDIYNNIEEYNLNKKRKLLIVFDDMIADILSKEKLNPTVTELFIRGRKLNICLVISQNVFLLFQNIILNSAHFFIIKNPNKREFQ